MISICIPVKNRKENLWRCVESIQKLTGDIEIIIGDNMSPHSDFVGMPQGFYQLTIFSEAGDWSIGRFKNLAAKHAKGDILFFLDADLIVPQEVIDKINVLVPQGYAYSPIMCMKAENGIDEEWGIHSFGQIAVSREQWLAHPWEEWTSYGGEDNIFFEPYKNGKAIRDQVFGFIHQWHSNDARQENYKDPAGFHLEQHNLKSFGYATAREAADNA